MAGCWPVWAYRRISLSTTLEKYRNLTSVSNTGVVSSPQHWTSLWAYPHQSTSQQQTSYQAWSNLSTSTRSRYISDNSGDKIPDRGKNLESDEDHQSFNFVSQTPTELPTATGNLTQHNSHRPTQETQRNRSHGGCFLRLRQLRSLVWYLRFCYRKYSRLYFITK